MTNFKETEGFRITVHMVSSLDGFIAKKDNDVSWFETQDHYEKGVPSENAEEFMKTIDCFVMGARTYELALALSKNFGWPYGDVPTIVMAHRNLPIERSNVELYAGDLVKFVNEHLKPKYRNVWLVGGAAITKDFINLKLADEIRVTILPIILGDGLLFFDHIGREQALHLKNATAYKTGMVELAYDIRK